MAWFWSKFYMHLYNYKPILVWVWYITFGASCLEQTELKEHQKDFATKYSEGSVHSLFKRILENLNPVSFFNRGSEPKIIAPYN